MGINRTYSSVLDMQVSVLKKHELKDGTHPHSLLQCASNFTATGEFDFLSFPRKTAPKQPWQCERLPFWLGRLFESCISGSNWGNLKLYLVVSTIPIVNYQATLTLESPNSCWGLPPSENCGSLSRRIGMSSWVLRDSVPQNTSSAFHNSLNP